MHPLPIGTKLRVLTSAGTGLKEDQIFTINEVERYGNHSEFDYYEHVNVHGLDLKLVVDSVWIDKGRVEVVE